jgi:hypothetical protein
VAYVRSAGAGRETVSSGVPGPKRTAGFGAANLWKTALLGAASSLFVSGRWVDLLTPSRSVTERLSD